MKLTEKKRKNIIDAAIIEFREQGFLGAKTTNIAKRANVSSRTFYNHFESKEVLFAEISRLMIERSSVMDSVSYDPKRPLDVQLIAALEAYVAVITEPEVIGLTRMVISELLRDLEASRKFFAEISAHDYPMTQLIKEAMDAGALRKTDPAFATNQLLALVKNFFFWPDFLLGEKMEMDGVMQSCVDMFLSYYKNEDVP